MRREGRKPKKGKLIQETLSIFVPHPSFFHLVQALFLFAKVYSFSTFFQVFMVTITLS